MSDLEQACTELAAILPRVERLLHQPDEDGAIGGRVKPGSRPPWNAAVAHVVTGSREEVFRLEAALRRALTGRPGRRRIGTRGQTEEALRAIASLAVALGTDAETTARIIIDRWVTSARQLPAVDEAPVWRALRPGPDGLPPQCPYCRAYQLRVAVRSRVVMCFSPACEGDGSGRRPTATMELGRVSGQPLLVWADGRIQAPPAA